jgi:hypothetical protein
MSTVEGPVGRAVSLVVGRTRRGAIGVVRCLTTELVASAEGTRRSERRSLSLRMRSAGFDV